MSLYTGVPDISIPLATAQGKTLALPIVLRYHAGGIRVEEIGGWVGLGWALEAGGTITRTVRGLADESANGYYNSGTTFYNDQNWPVAPSSVLDNLRGEVVDGEPDQFFFDFAGRSGQFVMGPTSTSPTLKEVRTIPYQNLRIRPTDASFSGFVITSEDGTVYTFTVRETNTDWSIGSPATHRGEHHTSSWQLTEVRSASGDAITLYYTPYVARHRVGRYMETFHAVVNCTGLTTLDLINEYEVVVQRLDSIKGAANTIRFTVGGTLRADALSPTGTPQEPRLDRITVTTPAGTVLRVFQLEHDYLSGNRLRLKNVYEQDRNGVSLPPYSFTYNAQALPSYASFAQDHWGYFNNKTSNTSLLPTTTSGGIVYPGANREPDPVFMKAGVLTRMTYPTGGYNEFIYEANDYGGIGPQDTVPRGLGPVEGSSLWWETPMQTQSTTFTVGGDSAVTATVRVVDDPANCTPGARDGGCAIARIVGVGSWPGPGTFQVVLVPNTYTMTLGSTNPAITATFDVTWQEWGPISKKMAGGLRVAEIQTVDAMGNVVSRKYQYTRQNNPTRSSGIIGTEPDYDFSYTSQQCAFYSRSSTSKMPLGAGTPGQVAYREVTVLHGATGQFGKTRHVFRSYFDAPDSVAPTNVWPHARRTSYEWKRGQEVVAADDNASGQPQRRMASTYAFPGNPQTTRRFRGISFHTYSAGANGGNLYYNPFSVVTAWMYQDSDTTTAYDESGPMSFSSVRTNTYGNPLHAQLTQLTDSNSDGTLRITRMKYPPDYATGAGDLEAAALTAMQDSTVHIHSPVIERWISQKIGASETVVSAELTSFRAYGTGQYLPYQRFILSSSGAVTNFAPSSVSNGLFTKDGRYLRQETANTRDALGRITQLTDPRSQVTNYQYDSNQCNGALTRITRVHDASGTVDLVTDIACDTDGFVSSIKDEGGTFRYFTYDLYGRLRQIENNSGTVVRAYGYTYSRTSPSWTFNPASPNAVVDTTFLQQTPTVASVVSTAYVDGLGRAIQTAVRDSTNYHVTATQYDLVGRVWRSWKPYTRTTAGYDASFTTNATTFYNTYHSTSTAKPYTETSYTTDALSRVKQVTPEYIGTTPTAFVLHAYGLDVATKQEYTEVTDESGKKTRAYTDIFGNGMRSTLGFGTADSTNTTFLYSVLGQRTRATDPRGLKTTYTLDTRGLLTSQTSPDAGTVNSMYDKAGNLRFSQDANQAAAGQVFFTNYDFAGRALTSGLGTAAFASLVPDGAPSALETTQGNWLVVRLYDAVAPTAFPWNQFPAPPTLSNSAGRLVAVASKSGGTWQAKYFSYDTDGQLATRYTYTQGRPALTTTLTYVRDLRGALTERRLTVGASTFNHWYDYDSRGLLWRVFASTGAAKPANPDVADTYRPSGEPKTYQFQGGPLVPLHYTIREQLDSIGNPASTAYPFSARYFYRANGVVDTAEFYNAGSPAVKRYRYAFGAAGYDALNRLKSADFSSWSGSWASTAAHDLTSITYDGAGNIRSLRRNREMVTVSLVDRLGYAYSGTSNRLSSVTDTAGTSAETWDAESGAFTYDANGNQLTAPAPYAITNVTYDHRNLLMGFFRSNSPPAPNVSVGYQYDEAGQRTARLLSPSGGLQTSEFYILDGAATLAVFNFAETDPTNPTGWTFNILAGERVVGRQPDVGNRRYYYFDLLGSTRAVVEGSTVVESYDFDPSGLLMPGRALGSGTKEGFTGKEQDGASGLDYFGARYYLPALGRWGAVDPLADGFPGWSPYNYAVDNPVGYTDPTGMAACDVADSKCLERVQSAIRHGLGPWWPRYPDVDAPLMAQEAGRCPPNCPPGPDEEHATDIPATTRTEMGGCIVALVLCNNAGYRYTWGGLAHFLLGTNLSRQQQADALAFDLANPIHFGGGMLARLGVRTGARKALIRRTGIELADAHAHHVFPVRFLEDFAARGVDISNSRYLAWWQATDHLSNARGYNRHWEQWFARHPNASPGSVVEFGRKLAGFYGVHVDF